jgi:hypothetical protein
MEEGANKAAQFKTEKDVSVLCVLCSILFYAALFYSILFYSILFYISQEPGA